MWRTVLIRIERCGLQRAWEGRWRNAFWLQKEQPLMRRLGTQDMRLMLMEQPLMHRQDTLKSCS